MKGFFTFIVFLVISYNLHCQERTITGTLTSSEDGSPLPGVSIVIKGTNIGTVTDINGYYSITAPVGSILVYSFVGMQSRELLVTEDITSPGKQPKPKNTRIQETKPKPLPKTFLSDSVAPNTPGVATLSNNTPRYKGETSINPSAIRKIRKAGNHYVVVEDEYHYMHTRVGAQFTSSLTVDRVNRIPPLQNSFAQGRSSAGSLAWSGAENNEVFSWGPPLKALEYNGSGNVYDKNGQLVPIGTGSGRNAVPYDNLNLIRTGLTIQNALIVTAPTGLGSKLILDVDNLSRSGIFYNSRYTRTNVSARLRDVRLARKTKLNFSTSYNQSDGDLLNRGANLSYIFGSMLLTPPTFDNVNGLSVRQALRTNNAWQTDEGLMRSYSPARADNPVALLLELPDTEKMKRLTSSANVVIRSNKNFTLTFNATGDHQRNTTVFGIPPGFNAAPNGRITDRDDTQTVLHGMITPAWTWNRLSGKWNLHLSYETQYSTRQIIRNDNFGFQPDEYPTGKKGDSSSYYSHTLSRNTHEVVVNSTFEKSDWLRMKFSNRNYFSNTLSGAKITNIFPALMVSVDLREFIYLDPVHDLKIYNTFSRTLREAPLFYSDWAYATTELNPENYHLFFENRELPFARNLYPETEIKYEAGLNVNMSRFRAGFSYFNNRIYDYMIPAREGNQVSINNVATVSNSGTTATIEFNNWVVYNRLNWGTSLSWTRYDNVVKEIYTGEAYIPLAGFSTIQTVLAENESLGVIYGTTYRKDASGQRIIGDDGFPIKDEQMRKIGNPIPDWTLNWSSFIDYKRFRLSLLFDFKKGGDMWNGTKAALDYHGRSRETGEQRNQFNYIFDGVTENGTPNSQAVAFYDPQLPVEQNRWVRYGWEGVGEDYIEDTSWVRLNELSLAYTLTPKRKATIRSVKFALVGKNIFLLTPYSGVDPASSLFGYRSSTGIDLFNAPATRSYNAHITFKI